MRTRTTWKTGAPGAGRRPGVRNKVKREVRALLVKLEKAGDVDPAQVFRRLQSIALGEDIGAAVNASRVLLEYRFGKPVSALELDVQHGVGPSIVEMLEAIAKSDRHRAAVEERDRRRLAAITVEVEKKPS